MWWINSPLIKILRRSNNSRSAATWSISCHIRLTTTTLAVEVLSAQGWVAVVAAFIRFLIIQRIMDYSHIIRTIVWQVFQWAATHLTIITLVVSINSRISLRIIKETTAVMYTTINTSRLWAPAWSSLTPNIIVVTIWALSKTSSPQIKTHKAI